MPEYTYSGTSSHAGILYTDSGTLSLAGIYVLWNITLCRFRLILEHHSMQDYTNSEISFHLEIHWFRSTIPSMNIDYNNY